LILTCDELLSSFALEFSLRRYNPERVPTNDLYEGVGQVVGRTYPILPATSWGLRV
jgi:hypothetical protein